MVVRQLARVAEAGPQALLIASVATTAALRNQIAAGRGEGIDLVAVPAARNQRRGNQGTPLERGNRATRGKGMTVEAELDERTARENAVGPQQPKCVILALLTAAAAWIAALNAPTAMIATTKVAELDHAVERNALLNRSTLAQCRR